MSSTIPSSTIAASSIRLLCNIRYLHLGLLLALSFLYPSCVPLLFADIPVSRPLLLANTKSKLYIVWPSHSIIYNVTSRPVNVSFSTRCLSSNFFLFNTCGMVMHIIWDDIWMPKPWYGGLLVGVALMHQSLALSLMHKIRFLYQMWYDMHLGKSLLCWFRWLFWSWCTDISYRFVHDTTIS